MYRKTLQTYSHVLFCREKLDGSLRGLVLVGLEHKKTHTLMKVRVFYSDEYENCLLYIPCWGSHELCILIGVGWTDTDSQELSRWTMDEGGGSLSNHERLVLMVQWFPLLCICSIRW